MIKKGFQLKWISDYRAELFGIAILSVMFFHFAMMHVDAYEGSHKAAFLIIKFIHRYFSSGGVDIFAFLSGMGLYYSFSKNSDIISFYGRRYRRILIPYVIVGGIFWIRVDIFFRVVGLRRCAQDFFFVTFFTEGVDNMWYILFIGTMYLFFPFIYKATFDRRGGSVLYAMILLVSVMIPVAMYTSYPELYDNINKAATRAPVFIIGILAGKYIKEEKTIPHAVVLSFAVLGFLCRYYGRMYEIVPYLSRFSTSAFALGVLLLCTYFVRMIDGAEAIRKMLRFFGKYSLEFYLLHILFWELFAEHGIPLYRASRYALMICVCALAAPMLSKITDLAARMISKQPSAI